MKNRDQRSLQLVPLCHQSSFSFLTAVASCLCLRPSITNLARFSTFSGCNNSAELITVGFPSNMFSGRSFLKSTYARQANIKRISLSLSLSLSKNKKYFKTEKPVFHTQGLFSKLSLALIPHLVHCLFSTYFSIYLHSSGKFKSLLNNVKLNPALSLFCLIF